VQVWRARDAISDNRYQVQSYLEHHWVIIKLVPCYTLGREATDTNGGDTQAPEPDDSTPNVALAINTILETGGGGMELGDFLLQGKRSADELHSPRAKRVAADADDADLADRYCSVVLKIFLSCARRDFFLGLLEN